MIKNIDKRFKRLPEHSTWLRERPLAHRGAHDATAKRPENSLAAFEEAVRMGNPIELDVQMSKDGGLFVFHDEHLGRMTGIDAMIWDLTTEELNALRLTGTHEKIPELHEVFDLVRGRVPILVEIKNIRNKREVDRRILSAIKKYTGPIAVESFNVLSIALFRRKAPHITRGILIADFKEVKVAGFMKSFLVHVVLHHSLIAWIAHPHFVAYEIDMLPCLASRITHWRKKPVLSWTIRTPHEKKLARLYSDNYMFEERFSSHRRSRRS